MRYITLIGLIMACQFACAPRGRADHARTQIPVGSNFIWYHIDPAQCASGSAAAARDPYAVIPAYATQDGRAAVDKALTEMRQHGQQIIALGLFHQHGGSGNKTILDSSSGGLSADAARGLSNLVDSVVKLGFQVLYLRFFPSGPNFAPVSTDSTLSLKSALYQENLSFIESVLRLLKGRDITIITDLCNECSPSSPAFDGPSDRLQARLMVYTRRLWSDYVQEFGPDNTVGFSIIPDKFRVANLRAIYEPSGVYPRMLDFHFYPTIDQLALLRCRSESRVHDCNIASLCQRSPAARSCGPLIAGSLIDDLSRQLSAIGINAPWIIGETFYNDLDSAAYLKMGMALTRHEIKYIFQWPLRRSDVGEQSDACGTGGVNVGLPVDIDAYATVGEATTIRHGKRAVGSK